MNQVHHLVQVVAAGGIFDVKTSLFNIFWYLSPSSESSMSRKSDVKLNKLSKKVYIKLFCNRERMIEKIGVKVRNSKRNNLKKNYNRLRIL